MAYKGRFIDRSPIICPAGKVDDRTRLAECLKFYPIEDKIDAIKHDAKITDIKEDFPNKPIKAAIPRNRGIYTESRPLFNPPVPTNYQTVINDLKETSYKSYWDMQLGKGRDPTGGLPEGMDPENTLFGKHYIRQYGMKELINPPKGVYEVLCESQVGHELYKKSHNNYNPSEQVNRGYLEPAFDPNKIYGMKTAYDPKGIWVKCACTWHLQDPVRTVNKIQADFAEKAKPKLGKCLTPNRNIDSVPMGFMFGKLCKREMCGVEELLKDPGTEHCLFKRDFHDWMAHISELRTYIKRRRGIYIDFKELYDAIMFYDKNQSGWIPVDVLYEVCRCKRLNFNQEKMSALAALLGIIQDGYINYDSFMNLIDVDRPGAQLFKLNDIPEEHLYYVTTSVAATCDSIFIDNTKMHTAGIPTIRMDLVRPSVPPGKCKADLESLGDETTAGAIVNPSIFTNYGLSHRDFLLPRKPEFVRKLFENVGYEFPDDAFEKLWKIGQDLDKTGSVCVDTFRKLLRDSIPPPIFIDKKSNCS